MAGGLPELRTDYGPDMVKILSTAAMLKQADTQNELARIKMDREKEMQNILRNTLTGPDPSAAPAVPATVLAGQTGFEEGAPTSVPASGQNALAERYMKVGHAMAAAGDAEKAMHYFSIAKSMGKDTGPEVESKRASTMKTNLDNTIQLIGMVRANPGMYPEVYARAKAAGIPLPHPNTFVENGEVSQPKLMEFLDKTQASVMDYSKQLDMNTPKLEKMNEGEYESTYEVLPGGKKKKVATAPRWQAPTIEGTVEDPNSPTGYSKVKQTGTSLPGVAPPAGSTAKEPTPFQAQKRISDIHMAKYKIATGEVVNPDLVAQFPILGALQGGKATPEQQQQIGAELDKEIAMLTPYTQPKAKKGAAKAAATETVQAPPVNLLKEGIQTKFKNGQVWTLQNGQPIQIQ